MAEVRRKQLSPGVRLTAVRTGKFKSAALSVSLLTPLQAERAACNALVPFVLRRGSAEHPSLEALSAQLDELYGGIIEPMVRKKGETQCVGFLGSFLDDAFTLDAEPILERAAGLMGELLLRPYVQNGVFCADYTAGERANLIDRIRAQINDKRQYSMQRLTALMCAGEAYGVDRLGDEEHAAAITPQGLWAAYQELLRTARIELYYCGSAPFERVEAALTAALEGLPVNEDRVQLSCAVRAEPAGEGVREVAEALEVAQGKLAMGFRTGGACAGSGELPALMVFNAVYGGTASSKLFMNVREKLSLCYFASSMLEGNKGVLLVSSGIEFEKFEKAKNEIMAQLEACRKGEIEEWEMAGAVRSVVSALQTALDSQGRLEDYWLGQAVSGGEMPPEELCRKVEAVTRDEVARLAGRTELDTVYFLKGREG